MPQNSPENLQDKSVEKNYSINIDKKTLKYIAGAALTLFVISGAFFTFGGKEKNNSEPKEVTPTPTRKEQQQQPEIPKEAQEFVDTNINKYPDPISTYYAEQAYEKNNKNAILTDSFIDNYNMITGSNSKISTLGFTSYEMPVDTLLTPQIVVKMFNEFLSANIERYMNLLAKNPSADAIKIIDRQFQDYCSDTSNYMLPNLAYTNDDEGIARLMDTAKSIVSEYDSASNFKVAKAELNNTDPNITSFVGHMPSGESAIVEGKDRTLAFGQNGVRLVIQIDQYNNTNEVVHNIKTIKNFSFNISRQPNNPNAKTTKMSLGQLTTNEPY